MRIVDKQDRTEIELDPSEALRRGRVPDRMLRAAAPPHPRGVMRGNHEYFNRLDDERQVLIARKLNAGRSA
jgi:hypothetical protein